MRLAPAELMALRTIILGLHSVGMPGQESIIKQVADYADSTKFAKADNRILAMQKKNNNEIRSSADMAHPLPGLPLRRVVPGSNLWRPAQFVLDSVRAATRAFLPPNVYYRGTVSSPYPQERPILFGGFHRYFRGNRGASDSPGRPALGFTLFP
jgi:hypothetical protein